MSSQAKIAPPPKKRGSLLTSVSENLSIQPADNMAATKLKDMSFKVDEEFHREFKMIATTRGLSMKDLLEEALEAWKASNRFSGLSK